MLFFIKKKNYKDIRIMGITKYTKIVTLLLNVI